MNYIMYQEEDVDKKRYSRGKDYSVRYGKDSQASKESDNSWKRKKQREAGLTERYPL